MADSWKVFKCAACKICHGRKSVGHNCPHCGQRISQSTQVVGSAKNALELRTKVIIANTPEELRDSLVKKLSESTNIAGFVEPFSPSKGLTLLRELSDKNKNLSLELIASCFEKNGFEGDIFSFMQMTEMEGLAIRVSHETWQILE